MTELHIDLETRSRVNLLVAGAHIYAQDPSTEVICMCFAFGEGDIRTWIPGEDPFPIDVIDHITAGKTIIAHNAQFERLMFWYVICPDFDVPEPALEQFRCSAAQARSNGLPGALEDTPRALGLPVKKSARGKELIQLLSTPEGIKGGDRRPYFPEGDFNRDPELINEMVAYCQQDVRVERNLVGYMFPLAEAEWEEFWVSEEINDRGVEVDVDLCQAAQQYAAEEVDSLNQLCQGLTGIAKARSGKVAEWVHAALEGVDGREIMEDDSKASGLTLDKSVVRDLLELDGLPRNVREVLELRALISASSVAKFKTMAERADPEDSRVRGAFIFAGAPTSGRFSARGLQLHNYPRDCADDPENVRQMMMQDKPLDDVMSTLASMLRPSLLGPLVWGDWSAIEARALAWLSADDRAEEVLEVFREVDADPSKDDVYVRAAAGFGGTRQQGKVAVLSLGYGGSVGAFQAMSRGYGVTLDDTEVALIVAAWRRQNPWAVAFWNDLHSAAVHAVQKPGEWFQVGRVGYRFAPEVMNGTLVCQLPSGRLLCYPHTEIKIKDGPYGASWEITALKASRKPKAGANYWPRFRLWRGLLAENITQAVCADLLRDSLVACSDAGLPVIGHVHDEIVLRAEKNAQAELRLIMEAGPAWADGLPLAAETQFGNRYSK